jgi:hypothetical protein
MGILDDYYEGSSPEGVSGLSPLFQQNLTPFLEDNPYGVGIASGFRTPEHQAQLLRDSLIKRVGPEAAAKWDDIVSQSGGDVVAAGEAARPWLRDAGITKWVAPPGSSNHQRGVAADLSYEEPAAEAWAHANADKYGLRFRMTHEGWHVEPADTSSATQPTQIASASAPPSRPNGFTLAPQDYFGSNVDVNTLPAGMRNNNPGNIKFIGQANAIGPSKNTDQGDPQAVFASPVDGMTEAARLAMRKYAGGKTTLNDLIAGNGGWTPGNRTAAANIAKTMGIAPDDDVGLNNPQAVSGFLKALAVQEHGPAAKLYGDDVYQAGAQQAFATPSSGDGRIRLASADPSFMPRMQASPRAANLKAQSVVAGAPTTGAAMASDDTLPPDGNVGGLGGLGGIRLNPNFSIADTLSAIGQSLLVSPRNNPLQGLPQTLALSRQQGENRAKTEAMVSVLKQSGYDDRTARMIAVSPEAAKLGIDTRRLKENAAFADSHPLFGDAPAAAPMPALGNAPVAPVSPVAPVRPIQAAPIGPMSSNDAEPSLEQQAQMNIDVAPGTSSSGPAVAATQPDTPAAPAAAPRPDANAPVQTAEADAANLPAANSRTVQFVIPGQGPVAVAAPPRGYGAVSNPSEAFTKAQQITQRIQQYEARGMKTDAIKPVLDYYLKLATPSDLERQVNAATDDPDERRALMIKAIPNHTPTSVQETQFIEANPSSKATLLETKRSGATNIVNEAQKVQTKFDEGADSTMIKRFSGMVDEGDTAVQDLAMVGQLRQLGGAIDQRSMPAVRAWLADHGVKVGSDIGVVEAYGALVDRMTPAQRVPGSGTTSDRDLATFKAALPNLVKTPEGNALITDTLEAAARHKLERQAISEKALLREISPADAVQQLRGLPDPLSRFREMRAKGAPEESREAPATPPKVLTGQQYDGLKVGDKYMDALGNIRTKSAPRR